MAFKAFDRGVSSLTKSGGNLFGLGGVAFALYTGARSFFSGSDGIVSHVKAFASESKVKEIRAKGHEIGAVDWFGQVFGTPERFEAFQHGNKSLAAYDGGSWLGGNSYLESPQQTAFVPFNPNFRHNAPAFVQRGSIGSSAPTLLTSPASTPIVPQPAAIIRHSPVPAEEPQAPLRVKSVVEEVEAINDRH